MSEPDLNRSGYSGDEKSVAISDNPSVMEKSSQSIRIMPHALPDI
jgi:hypothetical protein